MDRYLLHLVPREGDDLFFETEVTLSVGGASVSGHLITEDKYFALMAEKFENLVPNARANLAASLGGA